MRSIGRAFVTCGIACLLSTGAKAQQPAPAGPAGSVSGHVTCADTRQPARMASVVLVPVPPPPSPAGVGAKAGNAGPGAQATQMTSVAQTLLDGSYIIGNVAPGDYYVIVELSGYLSPLAQIGREDLSHPTQATADLVASMMPTVSVRPNQTARADMRLTKGATLAGAVRFDDGMPDVNGRIRLFRRNAAGTMALFYPKWIAAPIVTTDDQGRYRIVGLPAGEYLVATTLELKEDTVANVFRGGNGGGGSTRTVNTLNVYAPNVLRQRDGKPIKLMDGQDSQTNDVIVPLSKMHMLSGSVVAAETGQALNQATVELLAPDDVNDVISLTTVSLDDGVFRFAYIGDGEYTLRVRNARMILRRASLTPEVIPPGFTPSPGTIYYSEKTLGRYQDATQPIVVHSDAQGVTVQVKLQPPPKAGL